MGTYHGGSTLIVTGRPYAVPRKRKITTLAQINRRVDKKLAAQTAMENKVFASKVPRRSKLRKVDSGLSANPSEGAKESHHR